MVTQLGSGVAVGSILLGLAAVLRAGNQSLHHSPPPHAAAPRPHPGDWLSCTNGCDVLGISVWAADRGFTLTQTYLICLGF